MQAARMNNTMLEAQYKPDYGTLGTTVQQRKDQTTLSNNNGNDNGNGDESLPLLTVSFDTSSRMTHKEEEEEEGDNEKKRHDVQDMYPEASNDQRRVLQMMDDAMMDARAHPSTSTSTWQRIQLPLLTLTQVEEWRSQQQDAETKTTQEEEQTEDTPASPSVLLLSSLLPKNSCGGCLIRSLLGTPLAMLVSTIVLGVSMVYFVLPLLQAFVLLPSCITFLTLPSGFLMCVFPGLVALLAFGGTARAICTRFWKYAHEVSRFCDAVATKKLATDAVDEQVVVRVTGIVDLVDMNLGLALNNMTSQLHMSPKDRKRYTAVDPTLPELPADPAAYVEDEIKDANNELQASVLQFVQEDDFDVTAWIPKHVSSPQAYYRQVVGGHLWFFFWVHLVLAYGTFWAVMLYVPLTSVQPAVDELEQVVEPVINHVVSAPVLFWILALSLEAYVFSCIYIGMVVYARKTSATKTVSVVNHMRTNIISPKTTELLRQHGILFLCRDILELRMERAKKKFLFLIHQVYRLDMLREIVDGSNDSMSITSSIATMTVDGNNSWSSLLSKANKGGSDEDGSNDDDDDDDEMVVPSEVTTARKWFAWRSQSPSSSGKKGLTPMVTPELVSPLATPKVVTP